MCWTFSVACLLIPAAAPVTEVAESPRAIPIAYAVDVVVVGGTTGAVSAAVAASEAGARVFSAAPRPYLGEDMVATLRLWEPDASFPSTPFIQRIFTDPGGGSNLSVSPRIPIRYAADQPCAGKHPDTDPPTKLGDGIWGNPTTDSVQYNQDVQITLDLAEPHAIRQVRVMAHHRDDQQAEVAYIIDRLQILASADQQTWQLESEIRCEATERSFVLTIPVETRTRFLRLDFSKSPNAARMLISEIEVIGETETDPNARPSAPRLIRPMHIKKTLDEALLTAEVPFLYGCFATDVVRDGDGLPCGIVMANRAGRQAVLAKTIVDATQRATVVRLAGAKTRRWSPGPHTFKRIVIGGETRSHTPTPCRIVGRVASPQTDRQRQFPVFEYTVQHHVRDGSFAELAEIEQRVRDSTYRTGQVRAAERLFFVPSDSIVGSQPGAMFDGFGEAVVDACRPDNTPYVYVLSACADIPRHHAEPWMRPETSVQMGAIFGRCAAEAAKGRAEIRKPRLPAHASDAVPAGDTRETLVGVRPTQQLPTLPAGPQNLPVLGAYDVVVIGGGTSGAPAGIAAARQGAKTLVVEYQEGLGGIGTLGLIGRYHRGNRVGFTAEVPAAGGEDKMEWWRSELRRAGGELWLGALGCGAWVEHGCVRGAVVVTPQGRGVVLADVVVDATGNADIAIAAGATAMTTDQHDVAVQGAGMPARELGAVYTNTDYALVDDADMIDVWRILVAAKRKYATNYDLATIVQTRERRRVIGDYVLTYLDQMAARTYPDTIVQSTSNYDSHGYPSHPIFAAVRPAAGERPEGGTVYTPYRCLLPKDLDGILVTGLGCSAHRDAMALIRMQADLQNQGYAAGLAAAMAVEAGVPPRQIDVKRLQQKLVDIGNLPASVLTDDDSFPLPDREIAAAVERLATDPPETRDAAIVLAHQKQAIPLLQRDYAKAEGEPQVTYAILLAICGDATGQATLIEALDATDAWDEKKPLGSMAEYSQLPTRQDALIMALGFNGEVSGLPTLLDKAKGLSAEACLSHHRAMAQALERFSSPDAASVLAEVLRRDGMSGHAITDVTDTASRIEPLREIVLARALLACGDHEGLGRSILRQYAQDLRGHLARHATAILDAY